MHPSMVHGGYPEQIVIMPSANGYIVTLPISFPQEEEDVIPQHQEEVIRRQARIMNDEIHGDPVLKELQKKNGGGNPKKEITLPKTFSKPINVFTFATFPEVLKFLSENFEG